MAKTQRVSRRPDGKWQHKADGNQRATRVAQTQQEAIDSAIRVARNQGTEVVIYGRNGRIRSKDSFGADPCPPKDTEH